MPSATNSYGPSLGGLDRLFLDDYQLYKLHKLYKIFLMIGNTEKHFTQTSLFKEFIRKNAQKQKMGRNISKASFKIGQMSLEGSNAPTDRAVKEKNQEINEVQSKFQQDLLSLRLAQGKLMRA